MLAFLGEQMIALGNLFRGRAQFRWSDAWLVMQECGPQALGIVALINFLVGLILAFVGAVQLQMFGAAIYVADMVALGTTREMACMMTSIIVCGRTGAAFAAQLSILEFCKRSRKGACFTSSITSLPSPAEATSAAG